MTAFNNSVTEGIVGGETNASTIDFVTSLSEGLAAGDADASIIDFILSATDGIKQGDTTNSVIDFLRSLSEGLKQGDASDNILFRDEVFRCGEADTPNKLSLIDIRKALDSPESIGLKKLDFRRIIKELLCIIASREEKSFRLTGGSSNVTVNDADRIIYLDQDGNLTLLLQNPATNKGRVLTIKRIDALAHTTSFNFSIDGSATTLTGGQKIIIHSDGTTYRSL